MYKTPGILFVFSLVMVAVLAFAGAAAAQDEPDSDDESRSYLGVTLVENEAGAEVARVLPGSPAADAGLQRGDLITDVDGQSVTTATLPEVILSYAAGESITLTVERNGETLQLEATLGEAPTRPGIERRPRGMFAPAPVLGVTVAEDEAGLMVETVAPDSLAAGAGIAVGDIITSIDETPVSTAQEARRALAEAAFNADAAVIELLRNGETLNVEITLPELDTEFDFDFEMPRGDREGRFDFEFPGMGRFAPERARLGVSFVTLDEETATEYETTVTEGAFILEVQADSPAAEAGLLVDDVILAVDGDVVDAERTLADRIFAYEPGDTVTLSVLRDGQTLDIEVTLGEFALGDGFFIIPDGREFPVPLPEMPTPPDDLPESTPEPAL